MRKLQPTFWALVALCGQASGGPSLIDQVRDGVYAIHDDSGTWSGHMSLGVTHQNHPKYQARKVLDLSAFPEELWARIKQVRVAAFFTVHDYSWHDLAEINGLDEQFQVIVNGHANTYPTKCGCAVFGRGQKPRPGWFDFIISKDQIVRGRNEIVIHKAPSRKPRYDDYLYLCIDNATHRGNSYVNFGDGRWRQDTLTVPGGTGEYMVRLYLLMEEPEFHSTWSPGAADPLDDPAGVILFAGSRQGRASNRGLRLLPQQSARIEWDAHSLDALAPLNLAIEGEGEFLFNWLGRKGQNLKPARRNAPYRCELSVGRSLHPSGVVVRADRGSFLLKRVVLNAGRSVHPAPKPTHLCPKVAPPAGQEQQRNLACRIRGKEILLENSSLRCRFSSENQRLRLISLYNEWAGSEMVQDPAGMPLFLVEVDGKRYAGNQDFRLEELQSSETSARASLLLPGFRLRAALRLTIEEEGLRMALTLANAGAEKVDFKLAFPLLAGLAISKQPEKDRYFFPWGGGIFSDWPAILRRGYGDNQAIYQVMDLFSPDLGAGLYLRVDDADGWHKTLALRKHVPGQPEFNGQENRIRTADEYKWTNPLEPTPGSSFAIEYLRRIRSPGQSFKPPPVLLAAHPGDWKTAMKRYADWAHRVWKWRPYPSRLKSVHNMIATGWGKNVLFQNGAYRTDMIKPETDCIELMSWWDWSDRGPWGTPFDEIEKVLTPPKLERWKRYFVKDPVTGQMMWNNQPGDYRGYNKRFGGLPAFRKAIQTYQRMGAMVTLYTDPFRLDGYSCETGRKHGKEWDVMDWKGHYYRNYEVWNPCHYLPAVRQWVVDTMKRVMQETGADGIRLDEYGHTGWACFNPDHHHSYAEKGVTQWNKAVADTVRRVRQAMDEVAPGSVLTTEHIAYDYLLASLDGCITYDLTVMATPMRPLEVNLQRFYFPECKAYELDHRGADPQDQKKFWNGVASFGRYLPPQMYAIYKENEDVYASRDCEALVPTLKDYVYANRFRTGNKTIYHFFNALGHTYEGPALSVKLGPDQHAFDLLLGTPATITSHGSEQAIEIYLNRGRVACIAILPRLMEVRRNGAVLTVRIPEIPEQANLVLCYSNGEVHKTQPAHPGRNSLKLGAAAAGEGPACIKLLARGRLLDIAAIPRPTGRGNEDR